MHSNKVAFEGGWLHNCHLETFSTFLIVLDGHECYLSFLLFIENNKAYHRRFLKGIIGVW